MVNVDHSRIEIAQAELDRRGTVLPNVEISGHAIDRASLRCLKYWRKTRGNNEGLHAWLVRMAEKALEGEPTKEGRYENGRAIFVVEMAGRWPIVKTIYCKKHKPIKLESDDEQTSE